MLQLVIFMGRHQVLALGTMILKKKDNELRRNATNLNMKRQNWKEERWFLIS